MQPQDGSAEWSMHEVTSATGTTSRTLRHYDQIGLLAPTRIGANGYRYYNAEALVRLQRILLLRELGLGLGPIAEIVAAQTDVADALETHLRLLYQERARLDRQIVSVMTTLAKRENGEELMAAQMFDGFDHTQYKDEVEQRWGRDAYAKSDAWWRSLSATGKQDFKQTHLDIARDYAAAQANGADPASGAVRTIAARHHAWIAQSAGTVAKEYFLGLAEMYVADERFAANYGGTTGAEFVRDAMVAYAEDATFSD